MTTSGGGSGYGTDALDVTMEAPARKVREHVGPYRIREVLGEGGMGIVYRATAKDGTEVALKTLRSDLFDPVSASRFQREASIRIVHPNVVAVLDAGFDADGTPYVAFELLDGEGLDSRMARGPLDVQEAIGIARQISAGLGAAHALGYVHRDLKPANVYVCASGVVKILDFGIARSVGGSSVTASGAVLGTPAYLAPEQAAGRRNLDGRVDVWAFGVLLYEMLTGVSPFRRETWPATAVAVMVDEPPPILELRPSLPPALSDVVRRCLRKDRESRMPDMATLDAALAAVDPGSGTTTHAHPPPKLARDEQRVVAVVLARGVENVAAFDACVVAAGGDPIASPERDRIGLFGGARWEGDELKRAVATALACRSYAERIGVGSGRVRVSDAGIGGAVLDSAVRAAAHAAEGVVIDMVTSTSLGGAFESRALGDDLVEVTRVCVPVSAPGLGEEPLALVGRSVELGQIRAAATAAFSERRPVVVSVTGPAGIGKSRLVREVVAEASKAPDPPGVIVGRGEPTHREVDLSTLRSALRARALEIAWREGLPPIDAASAAERHRVVEALATEASADEAKRASMLPFVAELLGIGWQRVEDRATRIVSRAAPQDVEPEPTAAARRELDAARADPRLMADRLRLALEDWIAGTVERGPLLLVLEDAQWADAASIELVERVVESLDDAPLTVVVAGRDAPEGPLRGAFASLPVTAIRLSGLSAGAIRDLASELGVPELSDDAARALTDRTQGNPLFAVEILRSVGAGAALDALEAALPLTVEAAIQGRLDALPASERELCKRASVLGGSFDARDLGALGIDGAEASLRSLRRTDVLGVAPGSDPRAPRYRFRSGLVEEVAYRLVAPDVAAGWHLAAARHLETSPTSEPEDVASHWDRGGDASAAATAYAAAALVAARRGDSLSTLRCSDRALALDPSCARFELRMARADALRFLGKRSEQSAELDAALALAREAKDRGSVLLERVAWLTRSGRLEDALAAATDARAAADEVGDPALRCFALVRQAEVLALRHDETAAAELLDRATTMAESAGSLVRARVGASTGLAASTRGDVGLAHRAYGEAVARYRELGDLRRAAANAQNLADVLNRVGAFADAERALVDALADCKRVGHRPAEGWALANLAYAQAMQGRAADALVALGRAQELARSTGDRRLGVAVEIYEAVALLAAERAVEALPKARSAAARAHALGLVGMEVDALVAAARAAAAAGDGARALELARTARSLREGLGTPVESEGELWLALARAASTCGELDEERRARERGRAEVRALAAAVGDPAWRERLERDVPANRALLAD
ncbi:MAG: protein kinase [Deltaproteobacteria bacterium]|nr:protein kinase [Deltaproteobacteria bacterium]